MSSHPYQPGFLFIPFGTNRPDEVLRPRRRFISGRRGLPDRPRSTGSTPTRTRSCWPTGGGLAYDYLVIATGTTPRPDQTPGMLGPAVADAASSTSTPWTAREALAEALTEFEGGRLVVHITDMPIKCPVAPLEFTFLAEAYFRAARAPRPGGDGLRHAAGRRVHQAGRRPTHLGAMLDERKIARRARLHGRARRRRSAKTLVSYDEREVPFDLLVTVPLNMGADFVARSGLGDELNYVPVDKHTLLSTAHDNIFAARRRQRHPDLQGRLGRALRRRGLRRQLPRARRGQADDRLVRRARELLRRVR